MGEKTKTMLFQTSNQEMNLKSFLQIPFRKKQNMPSFIFMDFLGVLQMELQFIKKLPAALRANIYLPRLYDHGLDTQEGLANYTGEKSLDSAREALAVGQLLGEKVILMGTSTGCTLALALAAQHPELAALVLYAPNIRINHPLDFVATLPWGLQIVRQVEGGEYHNVANSIPEKAQFWTMRYRLEAVVHMQKLLETAMIPETFAKVTVPVFSGYYYKDETSTRSHRFCCCHATNV